MTKHSNSIVFEALAELTEWTYNDYDPDDDYDGWRIGEVTTIRCDECYLKKAERYIQFTAEVEIDYFEEDSNNWIFSIKKIDIMTLDDDEYPSISLDFEQLSSEDVRTITEEIDSQINK